MSTRPTAFRGQTTVVSSTCTASTERATLGSWRSMRQGRAGGVPGVDDEFGRGESRDIIGRFVPIIGWAGIPFRGLKVEKLSLFSVSVFPLFFGSWLFSFCLPLHRFPQLDASGLATERRHHNRHSRSGPPVMELSVCI